jgi:hypothetical protein
MDKSSGSMDIPDNRKNHDSDGGPATIDEPHRCAAPEIAEANFKIRSFIKAIPIVVLDFVRKEVGVSLFVLLLRCERGFGC